MGGGLLRPRPDLVPVDPASLEAPPPAPRRRREDVERERRERALAAGRVPVADRMSSVPPVEDEEV